MGRHTTWNPTDKEEERHAMHHTHRTRSRHRGWHPVAQIAIGLALIIAFTACGSSKSSSSASSSGSSSSSLAQYDAKVKSAEQATPKQYSGPTAAAKAPKHLTLALISCYSILHGCESPVIGATHAAKQLGWKVIQYDGGGNPSRQNADMLNAISAGANVIADIAIDPNLVQQGLRAAKAHGVLVVSGSSGLNEPNPTISPPAGHFGFKFDVGPDYAAAGAEAADWIIADSKGKGHVLVFSDKEFPSVLAFQRGLLAELHKCGGCKVSPLQYFTGAQVTTSLPTQTTGYLQSHSDINYVFSPYDPAAASQVVAIKQAGLASRVKLVSVLGDQQNVQYIRSGNVQAADAAYDNEYMGYAIVDQIIRTLDHKGLYHPIGENLPYALLTKSNLPAAGADWHAPYNYQAKFLKIWK